MPAAGFLQCVQTCMLIDEGKGCIQTLTPASLKKH